MGRATYRAATLSAMAMLWACDGAADHVTDDGPGLGGEEAGADATVHADGNGTDSLPADALARRIFHTPADGPLPPGVANLAEPWTGDLDGMIERRVIRILTVYAPETYYLDKDRQSGVTFELARRFERHVNEWADTPLPVHVVLIPVRRDEIIPAVEAGLGDIAAANLTVTPERKRVVDFSDPLLKGVREVVVTGPGSPPVASLDDLAGQPLYVRASSSYWEHLGQLGDSLAARGLAPVRRVALDESMEDHDALQMVANGLIPFTVVDDHVARMWQEALSALLVREDLATSTGTDVAWALRKDSPLLREAVNDFVTTHRRGTLVGNVLLERFGTVTRARRVLDGQGVERLGALIGLFEKYGAQYGIPWEALAAMAYQESGLDPQAQSRAGAVGIMQLLPSTAAEVGFEDVSTVDDNIHAAARYLARLSTIYLDEPTLDSLNHSLFMLAAYNAGPNRLRQLRREALDQGLSPDVWLDNVELVAARRVGRETVDYVSNIFKYYVAFRQIARSRGWTGPSA